MRLMCKSFIICAIAITALSSTAQESALNLCCLRVDTEPAGANVSMNNASPSPAPYLAQDIQPGEHLIIVEKPGYKTERRTVQLLAGQKVPLEIKLQPLTGLLLIHSDPPDVTVKIDEADQGKTPLLLTQIAMGKYRMQMSKPGYLSKTIDINIENRTPTRINETLTPDSATLILESTPSGAKITLGGVSHGVTPATIDQIAAGTSILELEFDGYEKYSSSLKLTAGQRAKLSAELKPIPSSLTVFTIPPKARIYINNQYEGESPVSRKDLAPGSYRIRAELSGFESTARTIELARASNIKEELRLDGNCGKIEITTEPAGVKIFIDDQERGVTEFKDDKTDRVSSPLTIDFISEGEHEIKLTGSQYYTSMLKVNVERGKTVVIHADKMKRRFIPDMEIRTSKDVFQGVLLQTDPEGNVKIEIRPGIIKTIPAADIRVKRPLRAPEL